MSYYESFCTRHSIKVGHDNFHEEIENVCNYLLTHFYKMKDNDESKLQLIESLFDIFIQRESDIEESLPFKVITDGFLFLLFLLPYSYIEKYFHGISEKPLKINLLLESDMVETFLSLNKDLPIKERLVFIKDHRSGIEVLKNYMLKTKTVEYVIKDLKLDVYKAFYKYANKPFNQLKYLHNNVIGDYINILEDLNEKKADTKIYDAINLLKFILNRQHMCVNVGDFFGILNMIFFQYDDHDYLEVEECESDFMKMNTKIYVAYLQTDPEKIQDVLSLAYSDLKIDVDIKEFVLKMKKTSLDAYYVKSSDDKVVITTTFLDKMHDHIHNQIYECFKSNTNQKYQYELLSKMIQGKRISLAFHDDTTNIFREPYSTVCTGIRKILGLPEDYNQATKEIKLMKNEDAKLNQYDNKLMTLFEIHLDHSKLQDPNNYLKTYIKYFFEKKRPGDEPYFALYNKIYEKIKDNEESVKSLVKVNENTMEELFSNELIHFFQTKIEKYSL